MKMALAQMEVISGDPERNVARMKELIGEAKGEKVDLIVFPEMCVGGYLLGDKWADEEYCLDLMEYNQDLLEASEGIAVAFGNIYVDRKEDHPNKDGRSRKYNAVYVFQNGQECKRVKEFEFLPKGVQPKTLLPTYRVFDDERYFFSLRDISRDYAVPLKEIVWPFLIEADGKEVPIGFELCEDLWCKDYREGGRALNVTRILIENGAEKIVNISASPWTHGKNRARDNRINFLKEESGKSFVPFYYVNCVNI